MWLMWLMYSEKVFAIEGDEGNGEIRAKQKYVIQPKVNVNEDESKLELLGRNIDCLMNLNNYVNIHTPCMCCAWGELFCQNNTT